MRLRALLSTAAIVLWLVQAAQKAFAGDCCDPASPFREGEGIADTPATCENIARWSQQAPTTSARITLSIRGKLSRIEANSALVYLTMCDKPRLQVLCVTYETNGMKPGDVVSFAGGYERSVTGQVVLDPCLATPE